MKKRIKEIFSENPESWSYDDLKLVLEDIEEGGDLTKATIKEILREMEENDVVQCATCGQTIALEENPFMLEFGPEEIRKEAYFCAIDCLQYFIKNYKDIADRHGCLHREEN